MKHQTSEQQALAGTIDTLVAEGAAYDSLPLSKAAMRRDAKRRRRAADKGIVVDEGYDGSEDLLQGQAEDMLDALGVEFRRVPDRIWCWLKQHAPAWIINALVERWRGKPDLLMLIPISEKYSLACEVELKSKKGVWSTRQTEYRERMPVQESRSPEKTIAIVESFQADAAIVRGLFEAQAENEK